MTITSMDGLVNALANNVQVVPVNKASTVGTIGNSTSLWRSNGNPSLGTVPTAAEICNDALLGAFPYTLPVAPVRTYVGRGALQTSVNGLDVFLADRIAQMGGLSGTVTTAQTVDVDVSGATNNLVERIGNANYSALEWWLEWYIPTGSSAVTATVTYTNQSGTSGQTTTVAMSASRPAGNMLPINPNVADTGIRSVQSVTLSATTGTAGNFGVTVTRPITSISLGLAYTSTVADWMYLGLARVYDNSCIMLRGISTTAVTGSLTGNVRLIQG